MDIHTDKLIEQDLWAKVPHGCYLEVSEHGSRSRARKFKVSMSADYGADAHGIKRAFPRNSGQYGSNGDGDRAATWIEWGDWMVALFKLDPDAIIGHYRSVADFAFITGEYAPHRPKREDAERHAARWRAELIRAGVMR